MATHLVEPDVVLTFDSKMHINLWDFNKRDWCLKWRSGLSNDWASYNLAFCAKKKYVAVSNSNSLNNAILIYGIAIDSKIVLKKQIRFDQKFSSGPTMAFSFSSDGELFGYSSFKTKSIEIADTTEYRVRATVPYANYVQVLRFLDQSRFVTLSSNKELVVWDAKEKTNNIVLKARVSIDGSTFGDLRHEKKGDRLLVLHTTDGHLGYEVTEIELQKPFKISTISRLKASKNKIHFCALAPSFDYVVVGAGDGVMIVYDVNSTKELFRCNLGNTPSSILFLEGGDSFLVSCFDGHMHVFSSRK